MQAALLRVKLSHIEELNAERVAIARRYNTEIKNPAIQLPSMRVAENNHIYHQYVIRTKKRDVFRNTLQIMGSKLLFIIPYHHIWQNVISI